MNLLIRERLQKLFRHVSFSSVVFFLFALIVAAGILWSTCFVRINSNEYGVKQVNIGLHPGIEDRIYTAGMYFVMPFGFEEMHLFPRDVQVFDLTDEKRYRRLKTYQSPGVFSNGKAAHIQTSDGFYVDVDVSILYRIQNPLKVLKKIGPGPRYIFDGVAPKAEPILKDSLGKLTTEEFYNPHLRVEKMMVAKERLNQELNSKGLEVDHVLIRYFKYSAEIQKNIEDKKLKDQMVFKNIAEGKAAIAEAFLSKTIQEGEAQVKITLEKGQAYLTVRNAEKDLYVRTKKAEADLLVKKAEAQKTLLKNKALKGSGSKNLVGLKMAEVFEGLDVIILPSDGSNGINPLDLNQTLNLME